ncbi:DinB family protein [Flavisolibacter nicotianae]|uniref:DinB family protein n=1 Tax=Flavisolibacter nicotianae TaxID=2364882 RepID=UPI000EB1B69F|nr:DinB family protein [Flavisolibacter nicotianae]
MKEIILQLATYHTWANELLLNTAGALSEEQQHAEMRSSFPTVYKTFLHMLDAESIWWQRLKLQEKIDIPSQSFSGDMQALASQLLQQNRLWQEWAGGAGEHALQHEFIYYNLRKERFKQPVYQMLLHLFNHGTYHRGQVVTMLRELGIEKIPQTDFIVWSRKK